MITKAEIINQPYSGQYKEIIYDVSDSLNSQSWTWVKFEDGDFNEWCGEFRGFPRAVALSKKFNIVLVLTSDYLFQIDCQSGELTKYETQPQYQSLTVTPSGVFIIADHYHIEKIESTINDKKPLESPIQMDTINFSGWSNNRLSITCDEFLNWDNHVELELDGDTLEITMKDLA
ncbi:hypothetical protein [Psychrobacillus sp. OK032]|uniref:hypothetical protein n=1 Tax=Psychrobacillus sp. OK032 TaxID=1884358 RepID=UPI0008BEF8C8|nr:hypothetical protein [Psychrobacillus sp. OK032]SER97520.1 hypothetical protein SAMN05518872_1036 [Psychrobacillus sp. OK032]